MAYRGLQFVALEMEDHFLEDDSMKYALIIYGIRLLPKKRVHRGSGQRSFG